MFEFDTGTGTVISKDGQLYYRNLLNEAFYATPVMFQMQEDGIRRYLREYNLNSYPMTITDTDNNQKYTRWHDDDRFVYYRPTKEKPAMIYEVISFTILFDRKSSV